MDPEVCPPSPQAFASSTLPTWPLARQARRSRSSLNIAWPCEATRLCSHRALVGCLEDSRGGRHACYHGIDRGRHDLGHPSYRDLGRDGHYHCGYTNVAISRAVLSSWALLKLRPLRPWKAFSPPNTESNLTWMSPFVLGITSALLWLAAMRS
jgi:hypothetical protein